MLSKSVIILLLACINVLAAPLEAKQRDIQRRHEDHKDDTGYAKYASYGYYAPPAGGYGKYGSYGKYPTYERSARVEARDLERRHDDHVISPDPSYGKYASYGNYPPPTGGYGSYGSYKSGHKRDANVEAREGEAAPAPAPVSKIK